MARRLTTVETVAAKRTHDPMLQPCFSCYTMNYSHGGGYTTFDHNLNILHQEHGTGDSRYGAFRSYSTTATEAWESTNSHQGIRTDDNPGSSSGHWGNSSCVAGYLGHMCHASSGTMSSYGGMVRDLHGNGYERCGHAFRDVGILVNETYQDYALFNRYSDSNQGKFTCGHRSPLEYYANHVQNESRSSFAWYNSRKWDGSQWTDGWYSGYGSFCYNKKLNKMVMMESNGSYRHRYAVWSNVPDLRAYAHDGGELWSPDEHSFAAKSRGTDKLTDYFNDHNNKSYPYDECNHPSHGVYAGNEDSNYRSFMVLCDNERLVQVVMHQDNGVTVHRWFGPTEGANAYKMMNSSGNSADDTYVQRLWTGWPHYGIAQGSAYYGWRWHTSSDGRYVWFQTPEHYYHAGIYFVVVRVADGKFLRWNRGDSTHGWNATPIGKSSFIFAGGYNTNSGYGCRWKITNLDHVFDRQTDNDGYDFHTSHTTYALEGGGTYGTGHMHFIPAFYDTSLFNEINQDEIE